MFRQAFRSAVVLVLLSIVSNAPADTFTVPLSVNGLYTSGQSINIEFDLGVPLLQVKSSVFVCSGNVTAGLGYSFEPIGSYFNCFLRADTGYMRAKGPLAGEATWPYPQPFSGQYPLQSLWGGTWNFLLDGHATGWVGLEGIAFIPEFPPYSLPYGTLNSSSIVIDVNVAVLASYEPCESRLSVTPGPSDPTLTASWPVLGGVNNVPPSTDASHLLKLNWTNEVDCNVEVKHTWTNFTFDWSGREWLLADVYFANPSSIPTIIGLYDRLFPGSKWIPALSVPDTAGEWHTLLFYIGAVEVNDTSHIDALAFAYLPGTAGTIYIDNLSFGSPQDIPRKTIAFADYDWWIKDTNCGMAGPGPNHYSDSNQNVWLDANEQLHLKIAHRSVWHCSEVVGNEKLGFGKYVYTVDANTDLFDSNMVVGLFTYDVCVPDGYHEIDVELTRWGNPADPCNAQFAVQPADTRYYPENSHRFVIDYNAQTVVTHEFTWEPNIVSFRSYYGEFSLNPPEANIIQTWSLTGSYVPAVAENNPRINFYLADGNLPEIDQDAEIVIKSFKYLPLGDFNQDGFLDLIDLDTFADSWLTSPGNPQWNPDCELAVPYDGIITFRDFAMFADNWRKGRGL